MPNCGHKSSATLLHVLLSSGGSWRPRSGLATTKSAKKVARKEIIMMAMDNFMLLVDGVKLGACCAIREGPVEFRMENKLEIEFD